MQQFVKDWLPIIVPCVSILTFLVGLNMWKRHLRGNTEHALALRVLLACYELEDEIQKFRRPNTLPTDVVAAYRQFAAETGKEQEARAVISLASVGLFETDPVVINHRWKPVREASIRLRVVCREVRALKWGRVLDAVGVVKANQQHLYMMFSDYYDKGDDLADAESLPVGSPGRDEVARQRTEMRRHLFVSPTPKEEYTDEFSVSLRQSIDGVEAAVAPFLHGRSVRPR